MQIKYNAKARRHIGSTIDYYLSHYGKQATLNLAHEIDEKVKTGTTFTFSLLRDENDKKEYKELSSEKLRDIIWSRYLGRFCLHAPHNPNI